jgi:hypothetical protein
MLREETWMKTSTAFGFRSVEKETYMMFIFET